MKIRVALVWKAGGELEWVPKESVLPGEIVLMEKETNRPPLMRRFVMAGA